MTRYPRRRDANEEEIVTALQTIGATVQRLDAMGCPDLMVGYRGNIYLMEVKVKHGVAYAHGKKTDDGLLDTQRAWWAKWKGREPTVVTNTDEAFQAIGYRNGYAP